MNDNKHFLQREGDSISQDCHVYRRNTGMSESDSVGGKPAGRHYLKYLFKKVWADKKLRFLLIVSFLVFKVILTITVVFIIPQFAR